MMKPGALQAAIEGAIMDGFEIPLGSRAKHGERTVAIPLHTALKVARSCAWRDLLRRCRR